MSPRPSQPDLSTYRSNALDRDGGDEIEWRRSDLGAGVISLVLGLVLAAGAAWLTVRDHMLDERLARLVTVVVTLLALFNLVRGVAALFQRTRLRLTSRAVYVEHPPLYLPRSKCFEWADIREFLVTKRESSSPGLSALPHTYGIRLRLADGSNPILVHTLDDESSAAQLAARLRALLPGSDHIPAEGHA